MLQNSSDLEAARAAIQSYYTLSTAEQLEPDKTQTELSVDSVNEDAAKDVIETLEDKVEEHKEELESRKRIAPRRGK